MDLAAAIMVVGEARRGYRGTTTNIGVTHCDGVDGLEEIA